MSHLSEKQLTTIADFGTSLARLQVGPYRCGKSYSAAIGFGFRLKRAPIAKYGYAIVCRTMSLVRDTIVKELESAFGTDVQFKKNSNHGIVFGHDVFLGSLNDSDSVKRIMGMTFRGILQDEATSSTDEHMMGLFSRISGESPDGVWYEALTNPQDPKHHVKQKIDNGFFRDVVQWRETDAAWVGAKEYYAALKISYRNNPAYYARYISGEWAAAEGIVYPEFDRRYHIISKQELVGAKYIYYKMSIDFGINHPTVICLAGVMPGGEHIILKALYRSNTLITNLVSIVIHLYSQYLGKVKFIAVDPSAKAFIDLLRAGGLTNVVEASNSVEEGILKVKDMLSRDLLFLAEDCDDINTLNGDYGLEQEFYTYRWDPNKPDKVIKEKDDGMDALRYLVNS